jgi:hypothetical protein
MRPSIRTLFFVPALTLAVGALSVLAVARLAGLGLEPVRLALEHRSVEEEVQGAGRRSEAKRQFTRALLEGRLTLAQAAARFRDMDADLPEEARRWRPPWYTEEEWSYRQVVSFVRAELAARRRPPAEAEAWVSRLEAELEEHLRHDR